MQKNELSNHQEIQFLRPAEVCNLLKISLATFWRLVQKNELKTYKLTERTTTVKAADLEAFIAKKTAA
jgi:excisionase family DNA binding protein